MINSFKTLLAIKNCCFDNIHVLRPKHYMENPGHTHKLFYCAGASHRYGPPNSTSYGTTSLVLGKRAFIKEQNMILIGQNQYEVRCGE